MGTLAKNGLICQSVASWSLREKCPNTWFFLVPISPYSDWIGENTDQKKLRIWPLSHSGLSCLSQFVIIPPQWYFINDTIGSRFLNELHGTWRRIIILAFYILIPRKLLIIFARYLPLGLNTWISFLTVTLRWVNGTKKLTKNINCFIYNHKSHNHIVAEIVQIIKHALSTPLHMWRPILKKKICLLWNFKNARNK